MLLLQDQGSVLLSDTKTCPDNTEELIRNAETMNEHTQGLYTFTTNTSAHPSPTYQTPQSRHQKMGTALSRLLEKQQAQTNVKNFLRQKPSTNV